jgi:peptidoglycan/xylan/chitin deacetylase (PgdA/CDA1 family)
MVLIIKLANYTMSCFLQFTGLNWIYEQLVGRHRNILIVFYHEIADGTSQTLTEFSVSKVNFERQVKWLRKHYEIIDIDEMAQCINNKSYPHRKRIAAITFDGGYVGNFTNAYPIIQKYQIPVAVYIITDPVDGRLPWERTLLYLISAANGEQFTIAIKGKKYTFSIRTFEEKMCSKKTIEGFISKDMDENERFEILQKLSEVTGVPIPDSKKLFLSWDQAREMSRDPLITIGSHSVTHPNLTAIPTQKALHEIIASKTRLEEKLNKPITSFCYPDGYFSNDVISLIKNAGYTSALAVATPDRPNDLNILGDNIFTLRRIIMPNTAFRPFLNVNTSGLMRHIKHFVRTFIKKR